ncbi:MAG: right-handed parallel beta-helix repeat-containing protein [Verrucomicrobia bacterium]|nr:right-handed parallel beta-helix repeat-containing protein [Verrucomicrobiota bacterium]
MNTWKHIAWAGAVVTAVLGLHLPAELNAGDPDRAPSAHEQLPRAMHGTMVEHPRVTVGLRDAELMGADHRVLQAAVDYVAGLGGGVVEIGPGEYLMRDSLHLRANVTVRGQGERTVLRKAAGAVSPLELDGDYGEEQITLRAPDGFTVGDGVAIWDQAAGGFHTTVARIVGRNGNTFALSLPLNADCMVANGAQAATVFPVISGYYAEGARVENLSIDGNRDSNPHLNGCRGAGIFLYRCHGTMIVGCRIRNYNGDGISFQQSNDVQVRDCVSEGNSSLGLHPGSGSQRPLVSGCTARGNGEDGLFLCWRVKHGLFENNTLEGNGRFGISIGHKDTDNLLRGNRVLGNGEDGIYLRNETEGMAGHRNRLVDNLIENNGTGREVAGIRVRGFTRDLVFEGNTIRDTRPEGQRRQVVGIRIDEQVGEVEMKANRIEALTAVVDDRR